MTRAAILVRLSREDLNQPGTTEDKLARHLAIARELAERHGLPAVLEPDIYVESGLSGRRLCKRPDTLKLLDLCRRRYYSHVVTAYQSRVLRGDKRDEADVEDAFLDGEITLITTEGEIRFDDTYEATNAMVFEIRAAADRNVLRDIGKKLKESNRQRTLLGIRSGGMAPYGYYWQVARYEHKRLVEPARYEIVGKLCLTDAPAATEYARSESPACLLDGCLDTGAYLELARRKGQPDGSLLPGVSCVSGEYAVLVEVFRRIRSEGYEAIVRNLNDRGVPTAGVGRFREGVPAAVWHFGTLRKIVQNRHYAGFPAHAITTNRKGEKVFLPPERHLLPNEEQSYPHPIRLPEHRALLEEIARRLRPGSCKPGATSLLTGILRCAEGAACRATAADYMCRCQLNGTQHLGASIARERANEAAVSIVREALARLPERPGRRSGASSPASEELIALDRAIARKQRDRDDLARHAGTFARAGGADAFEATLAAMSSEIEALRERYGTLRAASLEQQGAAAAAELDRLGSVDFEELWEVLSVGEKRAVLGLVIARLTIVAQPARGRHVRWLGVEVQPWVAGYFDPGRVKIRHPRSSSAL